MNQLVETRGKEDDGITRFGENNTQHHAQPRASGSGPVKVPNGTEESHSKPSNDQTGNVLLKSSVTTASVPPSNVATINPTTTTTTATDIRSISKDHSTTITAPSSKISNANDKANDNVSLSAVSSSWPASSTSLPVLATVTKQKRKAIEPPITYTKEDIEISEEKALSVAKKQKMNVDDLTARSITKSGDGMILTATTTTNVQEGKYDTSTKNIPNSSSILILKNESEEKKDGIDLEMKNTALERKNNTQVETIAVAEMAVVEAKKSISCSISSISNGSFKTKNEERSFNSFSRDGDSTNDVNTTARSSSSAADTTISPSPLVPSTKNETEVITHYKKFPSLEKLSLAGVRPLKSLNTSERIRLEQLFEFDTRIDGETWSDDWFGVLALASSVEVENPDRQDGERSNKRSLIEWVGLNTKSSDDKVIPNNSLKLISHVLRHVYNYKEVPKQAKLILANIDMKSHEAPKSIDEAINRISNDPIVLQQDGWTTTKASEPEGAFGRAYRIGEKIWWQGYLGVVIAFTIDNDYGDLWKGMWVEDCVTFDLEAPELEDSRRKYVRRKALQLKAMKETPKVDFNVDGIEHGIILATTFAHGSKHGVFWPARVMYASELDGVKYKRNRNKKQVDVVFLAPYWNSDHTMLNNGGGRRVEALSDPVGGHGEALFSSGPLFEVQNIDANDESIQRYPYDAESGLDIDSLRSSFKLMGLPKDAFSRFLDSQRLALGFKTYSQTELKSTRASDSDRTSAALLEGHPLAIQTAHFPISVLQLPFIHMLSQLPHHEKQMFRPNTYPGDIAKGEPAVQFGRILDSMNPPACWGLNPNGTSQVKESPQFHSSLSSPISFSRKGKGTKNDPHDTGRFLVGLSSLHSFLSENSPTSNMLKSGLNELVVADTKCSSSIQELHGSETRKEYLRTANRTWIIVKSQGESLILSCLKKDKYLPFLKDWRRCCERIYKHINAKSECDNVSWVITDSRCNLHLTSTECFERAVRLPAALKGARQAKGNIRIINTVEDKYLDVAENDVIARAHKMSYIQRIKKRCMAATGDNVVALTDDSDGNGGEDTKGSKGTWNAAISGVGAALQGVDMIMNGECLNAFCATRPPGHHAGRELHAMKAVSNGFCILNTVACAALYATAPILQGGLGLSRVCVIDIDVHHGNGTQDILCSTYDPRFLYVSVHAGGPDINGVDFEDDDLDQLEHHLGRNPKKGIFPGRCGDISPNKGVLNIPLGGRVTPHALATALVTKVNPAVEAFNPELIIISAGFDAHKNDPLNMGGLTAEDFGTLTEVVCKLAYKCCSGRVLSVLEGGYGVPCCRPQTFSTREKIENETKGSTGTNTLMNTESKPKKAQPVQLQCLDLGADLPPSMTDVISSYALQKRLDKCHQEGFVQCVTEHVSALARCNAFPR